ncbi:Rpm1 interacting protein [Thalictrum thalictroides]|uniref:Rpm1 interacting protein n=1 Tax=Thalictrum thalictroides TaxID=46969 RepID=A0A7J6V8A9_THATH|nr:Rpm1 interacting protein [Thalictrum thalictroides]
MAPRVETIDISSEDEEDDTLSQKKKTYNPSAARNDDDDCLILDGDPNKPLQVASNTGKSSDELAILAEKGQVACRDYPHPRHLCATFPFDTNPHAKYCRLCHCYVCDTPAFCANWGTRVFSIEHCHSTDKKEIWIRKRNLIQSFKQLK